MLTGKHVILRTFREADIPGWLERVNRFEQRTDLQYTRLMSENNVMKQFGENGFWEEEKGFLLILDREERLLGDIGFFKPTHYWDGFEIGYSILEKADRNRGYMTEALKIFSAYLFELKPVHRLQLCIQRENAASRRVAEKSGFTEEGVVRQAVFQRGEFHDIVQYSMLRGENPPLKMLLSAAG